MIKIKKPAELEKGFSKATGWQAVVTCNTALSHHDTRHPQLLCAGAARPQAEAFLTAVIHRNHKYTTHVDTHSDTHISVCFMPQLKSSMGEQSSNPEAYRDIHTNNYTIKAICPGLSSLNFSYGFKARNEACLHRICFHPTNKVILPVNHSINLKFITLTVELTLILIKH